MNRAHLVASEISILHAEAAVAEKIGTLTPAQLDIIYSNRWFNLFVPAQFGGLGMTLVDGILLEEELARIDGSLGWTCTLCSGASMFVGYFEESWRNLVFANPKVCIAGSGRPNGIAIEVEGGYVVNGYWDYASGAPHTTIFTANCRIARDGSELINDDGTPIILSFSFLKEEVTTHNNWNAMGLIATAGHSFEVVDVFVPYSRTFRIEGIHSNLNNPIFNYPFQPFAEVTTAVISLGIGLHFLDICKSMSVHKGHYGALTKEYELRDLVVVAEQNILEYRTNFYDLIASSWDECLSTNTLSADTMLAINALSKGMVRTIRRELNRLYPYCGMRAADLSTDLNRTWRDLFTASQHSLLL